MENKLNKLIKEVKENGFIENSPLDNLNELSEICLRIRENWKSKKVLVFCKPVFLSNIKRIVHQITTDESYFNYGIFDNQPQFINNMIDFSLYLDGIKYSFVEKSNLSVDSLWSDIENTDIKKMLLILSDETVKNPIKQ